MSNEGHADTIPEVEITFRLNGEVVTLTVQSWESALDVLRGDMRLTGTKEGCGIGECGACTILADGMAVNACLMLAPQLDGRDVETVEFLFRDNTPHRLQETFLEHGAVQCGFCTPGMLMAAKALLDRNPVPSREDIVKALDGNLCRCTGYRQIIDAVEAATNESAPLD